jgi:hypothetical protein
MSALLVIGLLSIAYFSMDNKSCETRKVAVLVADFQNLAETEKVDAFANTVTAKIANKLEGNIFDVTPIGYQSRKIKNYHDVIRKEHFESQCDTSGLFINGFLSEKQKVFNAYITIANLKMKDPDLSSKNSIVLDNPSGIEFSVSNDAAFFADFILAVITTYTGNPLHGLEQFYELEQKDSNSVIKNNENLGATIDYYKGNCYAISGDNVSAKREYGIVEKTGNQELKASAQNNSEKADKISNEKKKDPIAYQQTMSEMQLNNVNHDAKLDVMMSFQHLKIKVKKINVIGKR